MNQLRKQSPASAMTTTPPASPPHSRTMMFAKATTQMTVPAISSFVEPNAMLKQEKRVKMASGEQYWAARALTAETMLSAVASHQEELRVVAATHEEKRTQEIAALHEHHHRKQTKLERLALLLVTWLIVMMTVTMYLLARGHHYTPPPSKWAAPLHFTIPFLSPFTSVVEQEHSVVSTRVMALMVLAFAATCYGCFRYWLSYRRD